jgi:hypothetical protein
MLLAAAYLIEVLARIAFAAGGAHAWRTAAAALLVVVGVALVTLAGTRGGLAGVDPAPAVAGAGLGVVLVLSSALVVAGAGGARGFTALGLVGLGWWLLGAARLGPLGGYDRMGVLAGGGVLLSVVPLVDVTRDVAVTQVLVAAAVSAVAVLAWARGSAAIAAVHR